MIVRVAELCRRADDERADAVQASADGDLYGRLASACERAKAPRLVGMTAWPKHCRRTAQKTCPG